MKAKVHKSMNMEDAPSLGGCTPAVVVVVVVVLLSPDLW